MLLGSKMTMEPSPNLNVQVTVKDVARKAGVSTATAARVLGEYGSVSEQTREIVLKARGSSIMCPTPWPAAWSRLAQAI